MAKSAEVCASICFHCVRNAAVGNHSLSMKSEHLFANGFFGTPNRTGSQNLNLSNDDSREAIASTNQTA